jgi:aminoglycoside 6'-N-acetyltransferase
MAMVTMAASTDPLQSVTMILRPATPDDLPLLRAWDNREHVVKAAGAGAATDWAAALQADRHDGMEILIACDRDRPLGAVTLLRTGADTTEFWHAETPGRRAVDLWVGEAADLGQGHGRAMLRLALARSFAARGVEVVLAAPLARNMGARTFLLRQGFTERGRRVHGHDVRIIYRMPRHGWRYAR